MASRDSSEGAVLEGAALSSRDREGSSAASALGDLNKGICCSRWARSLSSSFLITGSMRGAGRSWALALVCFSATSFCRVWRWRQPARASRHSSRRWRTLEIRSRVSAPVVSIRRSHDRPVVKVMPVSSRAVRNNVAPAKLKGRMSLALMTLPRMPPASTGIMPMGSTTCMEDRPVPPMNTRIMPRATIPMWRMPGLSAAGRGR